MSFRRTQNLGITQELQDAILEALFARPAAELLLVPRLHLIADPDLVLSKDTDPADVVAAAPTFTGYASQLVVPGDLVGPINLGADRRALHVEHDFVSTAVPTPEAIYGYAVTNTGNTLLYAWEALAEPVPIIDPGDALSLDLVFAMAAALLAS